MRTKCSLKTTMKKLWILLALAGALLLWSLVRERFEATPSIKAPPYDAAEKRRVFDMVHQRSPRPPYSFLGYQDILMNKAKQQLPTEAATVASSTATAEQKRAAEDKLKEAAGGFVTPALESFFTTVFKPATTPITDAQVDTFVDGRASDIKMVEKDILKTYFVGQSGVGTSEQGGVDSYAAALAKLGQNAGYLLSGSGTGATGTSGTGSGAGGAGAGSSGAGAGGAGSAGAGMGAGGSGAGSAGSGARSPPAGASSSTTTTSATTAASVAGDEWEEGPSPVCPVGTAPRTNYSTVVNGLILNLETPTEMCYGAQLEDYTCPDGYEPTRESGGGTLGKPCRRLGGSETVAAVCPAGMSYNDELGACETTGVNPTCPGGYQLRGGKCMRRRTVAPAAPAAPAPARKPDRLRQVFGPQFTERGNAVSTDTGDSSKSNVYPELIGGTLGRAPDTSSRTPGAGITFPSTSSLGLGDISRYFPFSRTPGDLDVIPDPYRLSKTFSASSYSSKTEPAPFLTDFSAFLQ